MCTLWRCKYRHRVSMTNNYCAKFKSLRSGVFVLSCHHTYIHTHIYIIHDKVITISSAPYYVVGADNNSCIRRTFDSPEIRHCIT